MKYGRIFTLLFVLVAWLSPAYAAQTDCQDIYYAGEAPEIGNPKLAAKTRELCFGSFAVMHSG